MRRLGRCRRCRRYITRDARHCPFCQAGAAAGGLGPRGGAVASALYGVLALSVSTGCGSAVPEPAQPAPVEAEPDTVPDALVEVESDADQDGLFSAVDHCPDDPEDMDGFQDLDGCPDLDNDGDGIPDVDDQCPLEQEIVNGLTDLDGCPDVQQGAAVPIYGGGPLTILEVVSFSRRSTKISSTQRPLLTDIAKVLEDNPQIALVTLEGHTHEKERSSETRRQRLSEQRAEAVRDALVELGVDAERLEVVGYGDTRPIAPNDTTAGRANNRRVEFEIRRDR